MKQRSSEVLKVTFGLLFSVIISDKRIFTDSRKTLVEDFAQYLAEYASKVPKHVQIENQKLTNCTRYVNFKLIK